MKNTLLDSFYSVIPSGSPDENPDHFQRRISLNAGHPIYKGHFAQVPIAPGVCLIQIIKEVLMEELQLELSLSKGDNIKFLAMVNPLETPELDLDLKLKQEQDQLDVSAGFSSNGKNFMKFKGSFRVLQ